MHKNKASDTHNKPTTKVQELRIKLGFSQKKMAELMNMSNRSYVTLEKSNVLHKKDIVTLVKLCVILKCSLSDLIEDEQLLADLKFMAYQESKRNEPDYVPEKVRDNRAKPDKRFKKPI